MSDRNASFFGPVLPQEPGAPEAFSFMELQRIRANRMEADLAQTGPSAWPERRRCATLYPAPRRPRAVTQSGRLDVASHGLD